MEFRPTSDGPIHVTAWLLGERIETRNASRDRVVSRSPLTLADGADRLIVLYRFGAAVVFATREDLAAELPESVQALVSHRFDAPESDEALVRISTSEPEGPDRDGALVLREASLERLQVVADVLARSALLAHYETELSLAVDRIEPLAERMRDGHSSGLRTRALLTELGNVLVSEMRMVGRAEVSEKPERLWEHPVFDSIYVRFAEEYELADRDRAVTRKLELLGRAAGTFLEVLGSRRSLHVEWYIVALIAFEIALVLYDTYLG